jgi:hypothetical protein
VSAPTVWAHLEAARVAIEQARDALGETRAGVAGPQDPGEGFAGGIEIGEQRMEPEPALVGRANSIGGCG